MNKPVTEADNGERQRALSPATCWASAWKWFNRSAIILWILLLIKVAWAHDWQWSLFCGLAILGNAVCHWKTPNVR